MGGGLQGMGLPPWKGWSQSLEDRAGWDQPKRLQKANACYETRQLLFRCLVLWGHGEAVEG